MAFASMEADDAEKRKDPVKTESLSTHRVLPQSGGKRLILLFELCSVIL